MAENRECFKKEAHEPHTWHGNLRCSGEGLDDDMKTRYDSDEIHRIPQTAAVEDLNTETYSEGPIRGIGDAYKEAVDELLESRRDVYGDRVQNMERTAALWSALLDVEIKDWQVPLMMSAYKMLRTFQTPDYSDNSDDIDGWKKMFVEVMDANHGGIVHARTVEEYERKKGETASYTVEINGQVFTAAQWEALQPRLTEGSEYAQTLTCAHTLYRAKDKISVQCSLDEGHTVRGLDHRWADGRDSFGDLYEHQEEKFIPLNSCQAEGGHQRVDPRPNKERDAEQDAMRAWDRKPSGNPYAKVKDEEPEPEPVRPIDVECHYCGAKPGEGCVNIDTLMSMSQGQFHLARCGRWSDS